MPKFETWLTALAAVAIAFLLPMAAFEAVSGQSVRAALSGLAAGACDDGSAHLAMGCASIAL